jgi:dolichyl-phosphate-mannose--protein O-mannosyl transferase
MIDTRKLSGFTDRFRRSVDRSPSLAPAEGPGDAFGNLWSFIKSKFQSVNIGHLLALLLGLHLFAMSFPSGSSCAGSNAACVFDEAYYVPSSNDLLNGVAANVEHPFLGKLFGAVGIYLFGNDFFGWRIFYVLIGVASVWIFYELARLFMSKEKSLFAASLLGFETLFFIHTSLILLEGPPIFFGLLGFLLYFKRYYLWSALAFGLSVLAKEWGVYFIGALVFYHLYHLYTTRNLPGSKITKVRLRRYILFIVVVVAVVAIPLQIYDSVYHPNSNDIGCNASAPSPPAYSQPNCGTSVQGTPITDVFQNFQLWYSYQSSLKISASDALDPWHFAWNWINPLEVSPDNYFVTSVTYSVSVTLPNGTVTSRITKVTHPIDWVGIGNLVIWYSIWAIVPYLILKPIITRKLTQLEAFVGSWIFSTYAPSLYISAVVQRVVYAFYFINVDPGLCLGIPMLITFITPDDLRLQRILMAIWLGAAIVFFILFFPVHPLDWA